MTICFDKNSSSCECQSNSMIQRTYRRTKSKRSETSKYGRSQRIEGGKNIK